MRKIFTLFSVLLPILFSIQIAYASPLNDKIIIQQLQYDETTQNYTAINIKYNDKESTVPYITEKTDIIDKPVVFSEGSRNFIFISINSHLGTGLYRTNALIFDTDTLQPLTVKKDNDFIRQNFSSQISYSDKKIYLCTANQTIILQNKSRLNDIFTAYQKNPALFADYNKFSFPPNMQYRYQYLPQTGSNIICSHGLEFSHNWLIGDIMVLYRYNPAANCFEPDTNSTIKINIFPVYQ